MMPARQPEPTQPEPRMSHAEFVHLRVHSAYSLEDGTIDPKTLVAAVAAVGMPAVAMTDMGNLFAAIRFYRAAMQAGVSAFGSVVQSPPS